MRSTRKSPDAGRLAGLGLLCCSLAATLQLAGALEAQARPAGEIIGHVTDAATHAGVAGASVTALSASGSYQARTDRNGFYSIVDAFPNAYVLVISAPGHDTARAMVGSVNPDQASVVDVALGAGSDDGSGSTQNVFSLFQRGETSDRYTLNAAMTDQTNGSGGSYGLYQAPGIVATLPGATLDAGVNVHLRGGRLDEVGLQYDGANAVDPLTGVTATNLVEDGIVRLETDESPGAATFALGGSVDSIVGVGSYPGHGSITELIQTPTFYHGTNFQYGDASPDRRFSWFVSGVLWNSGYDWGSRGGFVPGAQSQETALGDATLGAAAPSRDQVVNLHYRPGGLIDDVQVLAATGFERFENAVTPLYWPSTNPLYGASTAPLPKNGLCPDNGLALFPGQANCTADLTGVTDHVDQSYAVDKVAVAHDFQSASFDLSYARVESAVNVSMPFGDGPFTDLWQNRRSVQHEFNASYTAQLDARDLVQSGIGEDQSTNAMLTMMVSSGIGVVTPTDDLDRTAWFSDRFRASDRLTLEAGATTISRTFYRVAAPAFTEAGMESDLGAVYSIGDRTIVRASIGDPVEPVPVDRVERIVTGAPAFDDFSAGNRTAVLDGDPAISRAHVMDASVERALGVATLKVSTFWRDSSDLTMSSVTQSTVPQSAGVYDVNGIDLELQLLHSGDGISGYVDYTHTRALSSATGDFNAAVSPGALAAHALFPVGFIQPDVANAVFTWHRRRWTVNPVLTYSGGYPYGAGLFTYNPLNCGGGSPSSGGDPGAPCGAVVRNPAAYGDSAGGDCPAGACRTPIDPGESRFADGRVCCPTLTANLNVTYSVSPSTTVGLQWENLTGADGALALTQNPYAATSAYGLRGFNGFLDYGATPYIPGALNTSEEFLFDITRRL